MDENALIFQQVRSAIQALDLARAEELLNGVEDHCAEWHFLMGAVCYRKGWMDEAQQHYEDAARMEPENEEYRQSAERMRTQMHYSPRDKSFGTMCVENVIPPVACCAAEGLAIFACCYINADSICSSCCLYCGESCQ